MHHALTRRDFLGSLTTGLTGVALASLMQREALAAPCRKPLQKPGALSNCS